MTPAHENAAKGILEKRLLDVGVELQQKHKTVECLKAQIVLLENEEADIKATLLKIAVP